MLLWVPMFAHGAIEKLLNPGSAAVPELVDVAVITTGAVTAAGAAADCAKHGIGCIIIIAGGFGETGPDGAILEERLKEICREYGARILGPNSLGVFVPESGFDTIFVEHGDRSLAGGGGVAFISQSGSVGVESLGLASNTGFGMRAAGGRVAVRFLVERGQIVDAIREDTGE